MPMSTREGEIRTMHYLSEQTVREVVSQPDVTAVIESMYIAMARGEAQNLPTVRENLDYAQAVFGFKSGIDRRKPLLGLKAGGFWRDNHARDLENHQSTVLLFDPDCGQPSALIRGNYLTALRTAAASAISIKYLARKNAEVLGIIGAGAQAEYQVRAALGVADFSTVLVFDTDPEKQRGLVSRLADLDTECREETVDRLVEFSDVLITITPATQPVVAARRVRPGTHIACMGADTHGKQELATDMVNGARLFVDDRMQSISIGEFQHAHEAGIVATEDLVFIGDVINGSSCGRMDERQVTIFDSSGVGLQDLYAAQLAFKIAVERGLNTRIG